MTRYERSAAVVQGTDIPEYTQDHCIQYIADNVDHNLATIDGTETFHGMGIVAVVTPQTQVSRLAIPKANVTAAEIAAVDRINIEYFKLPPNLPPLIYQPIVHMAAEDSASQLDLLWKTSESLLLHSGRQ